MKISATVSSEKGSHRVALATADAARTLEVPGKEGAAGSGVNGGEFLMLALATCFCNDLFREAARKGMVVDAVEVEASADFDGIGLAAANVAYRARVSSPAPAGEVEALLRETDAVAEVHNTLRRGVGVQRLPWP